MSTRKQEPSFSLTRPFRSIAFRIVLIMIVFVTVPAMLYIYFTQQDAAQYRLLRLAEERQGAFLLQSLIPLINNFENLDPGEVEKQLTAIDIKPRKVKLLYSLGADGEKPEFFYIASNPKMDPAQAEKELRNLVTQSFLVNAARSCAAGTPKDTEFENARGVPEVLVSLTLHRHFDRCWMVLTSYERDKLPQATLFRPAWQERSFLFAAIGYLLVLMMIGWLLNDVRKAVTALGRSARAARVGGRPAPFMAQTRVPELIPIAAELDRLVVALRQSKEFIQSAAEENAHALKTPLGVISQSLEPLRKGIDSKNERAARSLSLIEASVGRIDMLISTARDLESQVAQAIEPETEPLDLVPLVRRLVDDTARTLEDKQIALNWSGPGTATVIGHQDLLETAIENVLDNAVSFAPEGTRIDVTLVQRGPSVTVRIADEGPGVPPEILERIFERYVTHRPKPEQKRSGGGFGIGLWIVKRNIEALGGSIQARNRTTGGFEMEIVLRAHVERSHRRTVSKPQKGA